MANNKQRGNKYELECITALQPYYKDKLYSTRSQSRNLDNAKVDITNSGLTLNINYQVKTTSINPNYLEILDSMPTDDKPNVVINRRTKKAARNFVNQGDLVVMSLQDYLKFLEKYNLIIFNF